MRFKILIQYYMGHDGSHVLLSHDGSGYLFQYSLERMLGEFKAEDIVVFAHAGDFSGTGIRTAIDAYGVDVRMVDSGGITRGIIDYLNNGNIDYAVRVIGNNPFSDPHIIRSCLKQLALEPVDYVSFGGAPKGISPSEVFSRDLIHRFRDDADFNQYLEISKDLNIVSFFKKHAAVSKTFFDCGLSRHKDLDLSVSHPVDIKNLKSYFGEPPDLDRISRTYTGKVIMAHIEPTNLCNLGCLMCARTTRKTFGMLRFKDFKTILDKLVFLRRVNLNGDGEPFLNPDLPEMLSYCKQKGLMTRIITNATISLEDERLEKILTNLDYFNISLDGSQKESYERIRKKGDFKTATTNIKRMSAIIAEKGITFDEYWINFVIQQENYREIVDMVDQVAELGVPALNFKLMNTNYDRGSNQYDRDGHDLKETMEENNFDDIDYIREQIRQAVTRGNSLGVRVYLENDIKTDFSYPVCGSEQKVFVTFEGYVTPCCLRPEPRVFNFGNLLEQDYDEIFGSGTYRNFIQSLLANRPQPVCVRCPSLETLRKHET